MSWDVVGVRHIVEGVREGGGAAAAHRSLVELSFMRAACAGVVCSSCCDVLAVGWYLNVGADAENVGVEGGVLVMGEVVGVSGAAGVVVTFSLGGVVVFGVVGGIVVVGGNSCFVRRALRCCSLACRSLCKR